MSLFQSEIGRLRIVSMLEGLSYLALLGFAMPMKYIAKDPTWVRILGRAHGFLFVLFIMALAQAATARNWQSKKPIRYFLASLVPFGALYIEKHLQAEPDEPKSQSEPS